MLLRDRNMRERNILLHEDIVHLARCAYLKELITIETYIYFLKNQNLRSYNLLLKIKEEF